MNEQAFVDRRNTDWKRLSQLTDKADGRGIGKLTDDELRELVDLYRRASTDLAVARTKSRNIHLVDFLNDLVARTYGVLYREPRKDVGSALLSSVALSADTVRRNRWFVLTSALIFVFSWLFVFNTLRAVPDARSAVVSQEEEALFAHWRKGEFEARTASESFMMGGFYASNNPKVSIIEGAIGAATFGLASIYLLFRTGAQIGALSNDMAGVGKLDFLLSSLAPHGVPELSGMVISGAAGLLLGWAVVNPGRRRRGDSLKAVGKDAVVLIVTAVTLMFIAAPIEAFFSFNPTVPGAAKVAVALVSLGGWLAFWTFYGRAPEPVTASEAPAP